MNGECEQSEGLKAGIDRSSKENDASRNLNSPKPNANNTAKLQTLTVCKQQVELQFAPHAPRTKLCALLAPLIIHRTSCHKHDTNCNYARPYRAPGVGWAFRKAPKLHCYPA